MRSPVAIKIQSVTNFSCMEKHLSLENKSSLYKKYSIPNVVNICNNSRNKSIARIEERKEEYKLLPTTEHFDERVSNVSHVSVH